MNNKDLFHELNQTRQHESRGQQLDLFQTTATTPKTEEFWFFSDLYNIFGNIVFPINQAMEKTAHEKIIYPYDAKPTIQQKFDFCTGHYDTLHHAYKLDYREFKHANDLKLSRYACWSFLRDAPQNIFAQTYFLAPVIQSTTDFNELNKIASEYARIYQRERVSKLEKQLGAILHNKFADHHDFYHSTTPALFNGHTHDDIKEIHNIPNKNGDSLLNYMGAHTLNARATALYHTFDRFNRATNQSVINLNEILCDELYNQRVEMINNTGMRPEENISTQHIDNVKKHLESAQKKFISQYAIQTLR